MRLRAGFVAGGFFLLALAEAMVMDKTQYILSRLRKLTYKRWELFVISRIIHRLDDLSIQFVCQQMVKLPNDQRKLTDLYFPQFGLHLEIDEAGGHKGENAQREDFLREEKIVETTGDSITRIPTYGPDGKDLPYEEVADTVDRFVALLRRRKQDALRAGTFAPWDMSRFSDPTPYHGKGSIHVSDNAAFTHQITALQCFGFTGKGWMKATWPVGDGRAVWFPRLFPHQDWNNRVFKTDDGEMLIEVERFSGGPLDAAHPDAAFEPFDSRIVFARNTDSYGTTLYRFIGVFKMDSALSGPTKKVYRRTSSSTPTVAPYDPHKKFGGAGILPLRPGSWLHEQLTNGTLKLEP
jgi:hypothetical protein